MPRLLLVGWDAADWKVIRPLLSRGEMPALASILQAGVHGNLSTIEPALSPMVWTSIGTGKRPYKHGIHGFTEPAEDGLSVRPVSNLGRKCKAFWNILNQNGKRSIVVGWWPSHPAEPIRGAMVSNHFPPDRREKKGRPMAPGTVWPPAAAARLQELRVRASELTGDMLRMFAPDAPTIDQEKDQALADLAGIVAETMSIHAAATELIETEPWDMAAVYFCGIDHFSHRFMVYHAGKKRPTQDTAPAVLSTVVENAYRYHDAMLGRLMQLAGPDCAVLVLSDHGFHSDHLLPDYIPAEAAGPAHEHRDFGIFAFRGPGIRHGDRIYGASVLDIAPTILRYFGLPAARDMDGKPLANAFSDSAAPEPIESWEDVPGEDGRHPPSRQYDGVASAESLKQLVALGYVAPPGEDARKTVESCVTEGRYNLARSYLGAGQPRPAAQILEELVAANPEERRFYQHLFLCRMAVGDRHGAAAVLRAFDTAAAEFAPRAQEELKKRQEAVKDDTKLGRRESFERRQLAEKASGFAVERLLLRTRLALSAPTPKKRKAAAGDFLEQLARAVGRRPQLAYFLAEAFAAIGDNERALQYIRRARRANPDDWQALGLESRIHLAARRYQDAAARAIDSLALVYQQPLIHCALGAALARLAEPDRAEQAFRIAIAQRPGLAEAHRRLGMLLRKDPARLGEASLHLARASVLRREVSDRGRKAAAEPLPAKASTPSAFERWSGPPADRTRTVTIVSGLPRSGTSMMMQMLAAAGLTPHTDDKRAADDDNPRGYFEHEQATRLRQDAKWIPEARGRVVKIVATLLPHLPPGEDYRIVLMLRNLDEVVASQRAMLRRLKREGARLKDADLKQAFTGELMRVHRWFQSRPDVAVLPVDYAATLADPQATAARLAAFLGAPFDAAAAASSVAPELRRQKA